jgi:hypothetical protein
MPSRTLLCLLASVGLLPWTAHAVTYVVTNTNDSGAGSLRAAILNANASAGLDVVSFNIAGAGVKLITPQTELPASSSSPIYIDGFSQPGWVAAPLVRIDGTALAANSRGLNLTVASSTVRGLQVTRFGTGITVSGSDADLYGNYIGTDGSAALGNGVGIRILGANAVLGGTLATSRNVVSGNATGVYIDGSGTNTQILNCYFGLNAAGTAALANSYAGVRSFGSNLVAGGDAVNERNVFSGNTRFGLSIDGGDFAIVTGNYFGTNASGTAAVPNGEVALDLSAGTGHDLGGVLAGTGNLISGNIGAGVDINAAVSAVRIRGNRIGTNAAGDAALPNSTYGIVVRGSAIEIGGPAAAALNVISGNGRNGVLVTSTATGVTLSNNRIGTNLAGTAAIGNLEDGVGVYGTSIQIGDALGAAPNVISGNGDSGIVVVAPANGVDIVRNRLGTNLAGNAALGNGAYGIRVISGSGIQIGGIGLGNLVSGNARAMSIAGADGTVVQGNVFGLTATEAAALPNADPIDVRSNGNQIGGINPGEGNVIAGNDGGLQFAGGASHNTVQGNFLGTNSALSFAPGNGYSSLYVYEGFDNVIGGTQAGAANVITGNYAAGAYVRVGKRNALLGNRIYGNGLAGIENGPIGPSPNDTLDLDQGPNEGQNRPVLRSAIAQNNLLTIMGTLDSAAATDYRVEFFHGASCHVSGLGEGSTYLGFATVSTPASGAGVIAMPLASAVSTGFVTATATDPAGNTSEFSPCIAVGIPGNGRVAFWRDPGLSYEDLQSVEIPVIRSEGLEGTVSVVFNTVNDSATAPPDYTATSQLLTFAPGEWLKLVTVPLALDNTVEGNEAFDVTLTSPTGGAVVVDGTASYLLFDHELAYPFLVVDDLTLTEPGNGQSIATFHVSLTSTDHQVKVNYATVAETATEGLDYQAQSGTLTFPASATLTTLQVTVPVFADASLEDDETFRLDISGNAGTFIAAATVGEAVVKDGTVVVTGIFADGFE